MSFPSTAPKISTESRVDSPLLNAAEKKASETARTDSTVCAPSSITTGLPPGPETVSNLPGNDAEDSPADGLNPPGSRYLPAPKMWERQENCKNGVIGLKAARCFQTDIKSYAAFQVEDGTSVGIQTAAPTGTTDIRKRKEQDPPERTVWNRIPQRVF